MIDIAMIPVTDEPMEGVAVDVQDHTVEICTLGGVPHVFCPP